MDYEIRKYWRDTGTYKLLNDFELPITIDLKLNEEFDMAVVSLICVPYKRRIAKGTRIEIIEKDSGTSYQFIVVYDEVTLETFSDYSYTHKLTLVESASLFEKYQLPNMTFSKEVGEDLLITNILQRVLKFVNNRNMVGYKGTTFEISQNLIDTLVNENKNNSGEFFFNGLNLLEILREIGTKINAIPKLIDYKYVDYTFLNKGNNVWEDGLYDNSSQIEIQNPDTYSTKLVSFGKNIVSAEFDDDGYVYYPSKTGWIFSNTLPTQSVRISNNTAIFSMGNNKIYEIKQLLVRQFYNPSIVWDITNYVYEKGQYDLLEDTADGKGKAIIYDQYGTYIYGLNDQPIAGFTPPYPALRNIIDSIDGTLITDYATLEFRCVFRSRYDNITITEKMNNNDFENQEDLIINQSTNQVSAINFGNLKSAKSNKMGNLDIEKLYVLDDITQLPNLGDIINSNGYYVNEIIAQLHKNMIVATIKSTRDFNKISEFISVDSRKRPYPIPADNLITDCHINITEYVRLSNTLDRQYGWVEKNTIEQSVYPDQSVPNITPTLMKTLFNFMDSGLEDFGICDVVFLNTFVGNETYKTTLSSVDAYVGDNNSLAYSFRMINNVVSGYSSVSNILNRQAEARTYAKNGKYFGFSYALLNNYYYSADQSYLYPLPDTPVDNVNNSIIFGKTNLYNIIIDMPKDIREITNVTTQVNIINDNSKDLFIKRGLLDINETINKYHTVNYSLYYLEDRKLGEYEITVPSDAIKYLSPFYDLVQSIDDYIKITITVDDTLNCQSWFIADDDTGAIYFGQHSNIIGGEDKFIYAIPQAFRPSATEPLEVISFDYDGITTIPAKQVVIDEIEFGADTSNGNVEYSLVDWNGVINTSENEVIDEFMSANVGNFYRKYRFYTPMFLNKYMIRSNSMDISTEITNIKIFRDVFEDLALVNNTTSQIIIKSQNLDLSVCTKLKYLNLNNNTYLQNLTLPFNNSIMEINISRCDFINTEAKIMDIIDKLNFHTGAGDWLFICEGITDLTLKNNVAIALQNKDWTYIL